MRVRPIESRVVAAPYPIGRMPILDAREAAGRVWAGISAVMRVGSSSRMMGWLFCASLWVSSLLAVWMTLGWIGLFMSGHVLSAGTYWVRGLAKRTPAALAPGTSRPVSQGGDRGDA